MHALMTIAAVLFSLSTALGPPQDSQPTYPWQETYDAAQSLHKRIHVPVGYKRVTLEAGSFGAWLQNLPLKPGKPPVMLHDGSKKWNQDAHHAVVDLDVGKKDRQQCADAIMRLRGEFLFSRGDFGKIRFNYTHRDTTIRFSDWARGKRPKVIEYRKDGKRRWRIDWVRSRKKGTDYKNFRAYMEQIFIYAGTHSLARELKKVGSVADIQPGDLFIQGGFPGHAILVLDVALNPKTNKKVFLVGQSYMPAQDFHVLINPNDQGLSPWYPADFGDALDTPEWIFERANLKRFE